MKKLLQLSLMPIILIFTTTILWADNTIEKAVQTTKSTDSTTTTYHGGSGYQTDVKVLEKSNYFVNYRFTKKDFSKWLYLYHYAKSLDYFQSLIKKDSIEPNGILKVPQIQIGQRIFTKPTLIELEDLFGAFNDNYTSLNLLKELQDNKIIDEEGYLIFPQANIPMDFNQIDFTFLLEKIQKIDFGLTDPVLEKALCRELTQYMSNECKTILVKQEENTTYRSRQKDFISGIGDFFVGNLVGSVLYPSRISEVKQKVEWNPNIAIEDYFPNLYIGFNKYPFCYGGRGLILLNGQSGLADLNLEYMNKEGVYEGSFIWENRNIYQYSLSARSVGFTQMTLQSDIFKEKGSLSLLGFYSLSVGAGLASNAVLMDWQVGLTYKKGELFDNLGFNFGVKSSFFWLPFSSFDVGYMGFFQPNFIAKKSEWELSKAKLGLSVYLGQMKLQTGYQWFYNSENTILDQWFISGGVFF